MLQEIIHIGTLVAGQGDAEGYIRQVLPHCFKSFLLMFRGTLGDSDLPYLADDCRAAPA